MRVVVFAYHNVGVRCLSVLLAHDVDVRLVVTHEDDPGENIWFESVEGLARQHGLFRRPLPAVEDDHDADEGEAVEDGLPAAEPLEHLRGIEGSGTERVAVASGVELDDLFLAVGGVEEQLDDVLVRVRVVHGDRGPVVEAHRRHDGGIRDPDVRVEQLRQGRVLEREVVEPGLRHELVDAGRHDRDRVVGLGGVEDAEAVVALVGPQEAHGVVRGLDADRRLENLQVPLLHRFEVAGVQDDVGEFGRRHHFLFSEGVADEGPTSSTSQSLGSSSSTAWLKGSPPAPLPSSSLDRSPLPGEAKKAEKAPKHLLRSSRETSGR